jgi:beta-glucosidase
LILAHAHAVKAFREDFKPQQKGEIGITLNGDWAMPYDDNQESQLFDPPLEFLSENIRLIQFNEIDIDAAQHALDFAIGMLMLSITSANTVSNQGSVIFPDNTLYSILGWFAVRVVCCRCPQWS